MIGSREDGMSDVRDRDRTEAPPRAVKRSARPVVLGTLSVEIDPAAEEMAIASALEAGVPLIIANMLHLPPYPASVTLLGRRGRPSRTRRRSTRSARPRRARRRSGSGRSSCA